MKSCDETINNIKKEDISRRNFCKGSLGLLGGLLGGISGLELTSCTSDRLKSLLQSNLRRMSRPELRSVIERLEREYKEKYEKDIKVYSTPYKEGVEFGYALDLSRCIGCRRCVYACVKENNQSRKSTDFEKHNQQIQWIRVLEMEKAKGVDLVESNHYYDPDKVPKEGHFYMPVQCHQCKNPPCVKVCPVKATWQEPDGIVVIDYNWCIGCRYCMVACPYGARHFNWTEPNLPKEEINENTHILGNRPRYKGVVEKCSFCIQRTREGRYPACVEICPVGARKFGNLLDPKSEVRMVIEKKRVFVFKEELNTIPKFYYYYS